MRIYDRDLTGASAAESGRAQETQKSGRGTATRSSGGDGAGDRVEFSNSLTQVSRAIASFDSDRASRVQALAVQHQNGQYRPDSIATSRGIIAEALGSGEFNASLTDGPGGT